MKSINKKILTALLSLAAVSVLLIVNLSSDGKPDRRIREIYPETGSIKTTVSTNGTVLPRNRLEIMPSVAGRIEKVLVREGAVVRAGQILAVMSSTDRAALIDGARLQGTEKLKYWENAYKPIPIVAPISGTVIVRSVEPGQTVTTSDNIIVLSDRLIVRAEVDETDIGRVKAGQRASITLDSHPDDPAPGKVTHIYYESTTVNNVTIYYVIITPDKVPASFRSGMSADIEITEQEKKNALIIPMEAVRAEGNHQYVTVRPAGGGKPGKRQISTGISCGDTIEVTEGITAEDVLVIFSKNNVPPATSRSKNLLSPFMPEPPKRRPK